MVTGESTSFSFGDLVAGANNDCPDAAAPTGLISLTVSGPQRDGTGLLTLCIPRPDVLADSAAPLGTGVQIIDLSASDAACTYSIDRARPPTGTVTSDGMCSHGTDRRGFALVFSGSVALRRTCGDATNTVDVQLQGRVAVAAN